MRKPRPKPRAGPPLGVWVRWGLIVLAGFALVNLGWKPLKTFPPIEYVRVEGPLWYLGGENFRQSLLPLVSTGWFAVDTAKVERSALEFAWVDAVQVTRVWPNTVVMRVTEQRPIARWGEDGLLNVRGERFVPPNAASFTALPHLIGPPGQEKPMLAQMQALNARLASRSSRIARLGLSKRLAWTARLDDGLEIEFGKQDPLAALEHLLALLPKLGEERLVALRKVDLRYPNGFAAVFEPGVPAPVEPITTKPPG